MEMRSFHCEPAVGKGKTSTLERPWEKEKNVTGNGAQAILCTAGADLPWLMMSPRKRGKCLAPDVPCATRSFWHVSNANAALWAGMGGKNNEE